MKSYFDRNPFKELPDGTNKKVFPFHICIEGLENKILCRDDYDYDLFVKVLCLCARRKNTILVMYTVVSNHVHCIVLAETQIVAESFANEIKKLYSMHFCKKYNDSSVLKRNDSKAIFLDSDFYVRNAIAYVIRNAMDNGATAIQDYRWTGFRAVFSGGRIPANKPVRQVSLLSCRDVRQIMHTGDKLDDVNWLIDEAGELEPVSICDWRYIESAFNNDQSFFLRLIGGVNTSEMTNKLLIAPRQMRTDNELLLSTNELSQRWFSANVNELSIEKRAKLLIYVYHSFKTTPAQLARVFELKEDTIRQLLGKKR